MSNFSNNIENKYITRIVGARNHSLLKVSLDFQTNHLKMKLIKGELLTETQIITDYNLLSWEEKSKNILNMHNFNSFPVSEFSKEELRDMMKSYIYSYIEDLNKRRVLDYSEEEKENIKKYKGPSIEIIEWLASFSNKKTDKRIIKCASEIINEVEDIEDKLFSNNVYNLKLDEYILYLGDKDKYKGCLGTIEEINPSKESSILVTFPGKGTVKTSECSGKLWCDKDNLFSIKDVKEEKEMLKC